MLWRRPQPCPPPIHHLPFPMTSSTQEGFPRTALKAQPPAQKPVEARLGSRHCRLLGGPTPMPCSLPLPTHSRFCPSPFLLTPGSGYTADSVQSPPRREDHYQLVCFLCPRPGKEPTLPIPWSHAPSLPQSSLLAALTFVRLRWCMWRHGSQKHDCGVRPSPH